MKTKKIYRDVIKCVGCRSCEISCSVAHSESKELAKAVYETSVPKYRVWLEDIEGFSVPLQCRQCEAAPCVQVCPTKAITRKKLEEPVVIASELCVGCSSCVTVCPWGVIRLSKDGKVIIKCDLCIERLQAGKEPACVEGCPTGALKFKAIAELSGKTK
jgi:carbon-monoxide dehydrogenase iron sulfur subunit